MAARRGGHVAGLGAETINARIVGSGGGIRVPDTRMTILRLLMLWHTRVYVVSYHIDFRSTPIRRAPLLAGRMLQTVGTIPLSREAL